MSNSSVVDHPSQELARLNAENNRLHEQLLNGGTGGGTGGMDAWQSTVESRLSRLSGDIRKLLGVILTSFVLLASMIITSYLMADGKIDRIENTVIKTEQKIDKLIR